MDVGYSYIQSGAGWAAGRWCLQASVDTSVSKKKKERREKVIKKKKRCLSLVSIAFTRASSAQTANTRGRNNLLGGEEEEDEICQKKRPELSIDWLTGMLVVNCCHLRGGGLGGGEHRG